MNWKCHLGFHDWQPLDTWQELEDFYRKMGVEKELPLWTRLIYLEGRPDSVCIRCGKQSLEELELNKRALLRRKGKRFVLKKGIVTIKKNRD